jgi:hypothetical protein
MGWASARAVACRTYVHRSFQTCLPCHLQAPGRQQPERDAAQGVGRHDRFDTVVRTPRRPLAVPPVTTLLSVSLPRLRLAPKRWCASTSGKLWQAHLCTDMGGEVAGSLAWRLDCCHHSNESINKPRVEALLVLGWRGALEQLPLRPRSPFQSSPPARVRPSCGAGCPVFGQRLMSTGLPLFVEHMLMASDARACTCS